MSGIAVMQQCIGKKRPVCRLQGNGHTGGIHTAAEFKRRSRCMLQHRTTTQIDQIDETRGDMCPRS